MCVAQAAAVTRILSSLGLVNPPQGISSSNGGSGGSHSRFLEALEDNITPPKMLGVLSDAYAARKAQSEAAANAAKAKERARGKAAFGSGAGSVADDLNEHVFGKSKVKRKVYMSDGSTKEISKARPKGGNRSGSSTSSSRSTASVGGGETTASSRSCRS